MFESAELNHDISKAVYRREEPKLRQALLDAQNELQQQRRFAVLIMIAGVEGAGKGEIVNKLNEWMDPRQIQVHAFHLPSDEEDERPNMWRFWRALPPKGRIGVFFGAWHTQPILDRVLGDLKSAEYTRRISEIQRMEKMLCDEGVLVLKFWFHLSKKQQKKRLKQLSKDLKTSWRVTKFEWKMFDHYDDFTRVCDPFIRRTSSAEAPWIPIPGADERYRSLAVGRTLLAALRERLDEKPVKQLPDKTPPLLPALDHLNVIRALDLDQSMTKDEFRKEFDKWSARLFALTLHPRFEDITVVAVFEGNDAAGKGGAIRRVTRSTRGAITRSRSRRRARRSARNLTCGASGGTYPGVGSSAFSTVRGTGGCWWSAWRDSAPKPTGCEATTRSTNSSRSSTGTTSWW
jgi:polyphosphate kinase 2 (PPK2 family)